MQSETNNKEKGFSVNKIYSTYIKISIIYLKKNTWILYWVDGNMNKQAIVIYLLR